MHAIREPPVPRLVDVLLERRILVCVGSGGVGTTTPAAALALAAARMLASVVYLTSPRDPAVFGAVGFAMAAVAITAGWNPALRALRTDAVTALRAD